MLLRMYLRWAEHRGFKADLIEATPGEEAGLKSATLTLAGDNAYGIITAEKGVHRLVRLSPFDKDHRRAHRVRERRGGAVDRRRRRRRHRREGPAHRHLPLAGRRRPARQQDRLGRPHHAPADRHRRAVPERALAAAEPPGRDARPEEPPARARARSGARRSSPRSAASRRTSRSGVKSARMSCTRTRWSTTTGRASRTRNVTGRSRRRPRPVHPRLPARSGRRTARNGDAVPSRPPGRCARPEVR